MKTPNNSRYLPLLPCKKLFGMALGNADDSHAQAYGENCCATGAVTLATINGATDGATVEKNIFNEKQREKSRVDAERFLIALEENATRLANLSRQVEEDASKYDVSAYDHFRDELQNFRSLSTLIESRLKVISDEKKGEELGEKFQQLQVVMLSLYIKTCLKTFFVYSAKSMLSLGSKERFLSDLRFLKDAEERLHQPKYAEMMSDDAAMDLEMAQDVLQEIISKAPGLLDYGRAVQPRR